jgi:hypothetical protein
MKRTRATTPGEAAGAGPGSGPQGYRATGWARWLIFAAVLMILLGAFHTIQGLIALFNSEYYLVGPKGSRCTWTTPPGDGST